MHRPLQPLPQGGVTPNRQHRQHPDNFPSQGPRQATDPFRYTINNGLETIFTDRMPSERPSNVNHPAVLDVTFSCTLQWLGWTCQCVRVRRSWRSAQRVVAGTCRTSSGLTGHALVPRRVRGCWLCGLDRSCACVMSSSHHQLTLVH